MAISTQTPMMVQWDACKAKAPDALLFFRLGDFYEAFHEDANVIAKILGLTLTARQGIPMCGVPFHAADSYLDKLVAKGYKVAIAEQMEDPKSTKGLVKREVVRVVSPGTLIQSGLLSDKKNNYFVSLTSGPPYRLAALDLSTGELFTSQFEDKERLLDTLFRLRPSEILASTEWRTSDPRFFLTLSQMCPFRLNERPFSEQGHETAAKALWDYLGKELNLSLEHVVVTPSSEPEGYLTLDRATLRHLELTEATHPQGKETLLSFLDRTVTAMGGRLLSDWIQRPLLSLPNIESRQQAVEALTKREAHIERLQKLLAPVRDLERLLTKISSRCATPRELLSLGLSLAQVEPLQAALLEFSPRLLEQSRNALSDPLSKRLLSALNEAPPLRIGEGDLFRDGYHPELDQLRKLARDSVSWISAYQVQLREETGIKNLKVGYTRAFGYYIELSRAHTGHLPPSFERRQTLVNGERFITEELKRYEHQVLAAEELAKALEAELFEQLRLEVASHATSIRATSRAIATIDVLLSLASVATEYTFVKPTLDHSDRIEIQEGRHPIVQAALGKGSFIPNDTHLSKEAQLILITGPNMAGKSTYIRQVALLVLLAQMGSFVPAKAAHIGIVDKIFSRIGASDDLARGHSTFMVEMTETAHILKHATSRSLVLLDEIGRGTSTYDGISIAWAVAEYLLTTPSRQAKTLFATHYWELTRLEATFRNAVNYQVAVQETAEGIVFLRKILRGGTDKSYGIHVAKLAGLPDAVIARAEQMLRHLETSAPKQPRKARTLEESQLQFDL